MRSNNKKNDSSPIFNIFGTVVKVAAVAATGYMVSRAFREVEKELEKQRESQDRRSFERVRNQESREQWDQPHARDNNEERKENEQIPIPQPQSSANSGSNSRDFEAFPGISREEWEILEQNADESMLCPISKTLLTDPVILVTCGHTFQKEYIDEWLRRKDMCPVCKAKTKGNCVAPNFTVKSLVGGYIQRTKKIIQ